MAPPIRSRADKKKWRRMFSQVNMTSLIGPENYVTILGSNFLMRILALFLVAPLVALAQTIKPRLRSYNLAVQRW